MVLGHSLGELAAATAAGVFTPEDALMIAAARARLIASLPPGAMTAVALSRAEIEAIDEAAHFDRRDQRLEHDRHRRRDRGRRRARAPPHRARDHLKRLDVEHAVHSEAMRPIAAALTDVVASCPRRPPRLPYLSNVTGALLSADEAMRPAYWAEHLCDTVALAPAIDHLLADSAQVIVEIGPGAGLASLVRLASKRHGGAPRTTVVSSRAEGGGEDIRHLLAAVAELWLAGVAVEWRGLWPDGLPAASRSRPTHSSARATGSTAR